MRHCCYGSPSVNDDDEPAEIEPVEPLPGPGLAAIVSSSTFLVVRCSRGFPVQPRRSLWGHFEQADRQEILAALASEEPYTTVLCNRQRSSRYDVKLLRNDADTFTFQVLRVVKNSKAAPKSEAHGPWPFSEIENKGILGQGGFGTVYRATENGLALAVKVSTCLSSDDSDSLEAVLSSDFDHPNVLKTLRHTVCRHSVNMKDIWMVMPLCKLGSLVEVIDSKHFTSEAIVLHVALQIAEGMGYLHARHVLHGDLTPANVLFDEGHTVKISDFGLSRVDVTGTIQTRTTGAPLYAAPEIEQGRLSPAADVYSFGLLLWEMLHGRRVFTGTEQHPLDVKRRSPSPAFEVASSAFCKHLVAQCTSAQHSRPSFAKVSAAIRAGKSGGVEHQ